MSQRLSSTVHKHIKTGSRLNLMFLALTTFIGLPVIFFIILAIQGFIAQAGNATPYDITVSKITKSEAVISWNTDKKTQGVVEYGTSPSALSSYAPEVSSKKEHEVKLTLLTPATTYYYQITIDGTTYDNEGVPWTFTTKTKDGEDFADAVKGISTRVLRGDEATEEAGLSTSNCTATACQDIKNMLGKGCSSADYLKCISGQTSVSGTPAVAVSGIPLYNTPTPTPSPIMIASNLCKLDYLQVGDDCTEWMWDSFDTKPQFCRDAFDRYVFQCRSASFAGTTDPNIVWYYNGALTKISSNSAELKVTPENGKTVYCQVRAEDEVGGASHSTAWARAEKKCEF